MIFEIKGKIKNYKSLTKTYKNIVKIILINKPIWNTNLSAFSFTPFNQNNSKKFNRNIREQIANLSQIVFKPKLWRDNLTIQ